MRDYPWRQRRQSGAAGNARPETQAGATGSGGPLGWVRRHFITSIIGIVSIVGAALVASLNGLLGDAVRSALHDVVPDTICALRESVTNDPPPTADRFRILIATIDGDDFDKK
jgi:hypothetical protein